MQTRIPEHWWIWVLYGMGVLLLIGLILFVVFTPETVAPTQPVASPTVLSSGSPSAEPTKILQKAASPTPVGTSPVVNGFTPTPAPRYSPTPKLTSLPSPTPTPTRGPKPTPSPKPTRTPKPTSSLTPTPSPTPLPLLPGLILLVIAVGASQTPTTFRKVTRISKRPKRWPLNRQ